MNSTVPFNFEGAKTQIVNRDGEPCHCEVLIHDGVLLCPNCGSQYLHQQHIRVFTRLQEDGDAVRNDSDAFGCTSTSIRKSAPGRRDSVFIEFSCEECGENEIGDTQPPKLFYLSIMQHKGMTQASWVAELPTGNEGGHQTPLCGKNNH